LGEYRNDRRIECQPFNQFEGGKDVPVARHTMNAAWIASFAATIARWLSLTKPIFPRVRTSGATPERRCNRILT
jgi:hypothetical protein